MKIFTITLHFPECRIEMPYYFTSYKEAVLYGEFQFREYYDITYYEIENKFKPVQFYKLK